MMHRRTYQMDGEPAGSAQGVSPAQDPMDELKAKTQRIENDHKEFRQISDSWAASLKQAFHSLPAVKF